MKQKRWNRIALALLMVVVILVPILYINFTGRYLHRRAVVAFSRQQGKRITDHGEVHFKGLRWGQGPYLLWELNGLVYESRDDSIDSYECVQFHLPLRQIQPFHWHQQEFEVHYGAPSAHPAGSKPKALP